ncbi:DUF1616 domain-containing protein [Natrialba taiwanensis]|uniref:DUF1616 domain-containing protein n=1 Tax=Natrialba taiwanensis DSM 12281 TaxID=1230458 RepID=L9ZH13_9EURY|nr:DUF1616 domain-containing protein [Natrialba taiwanensis]ELY85629.1 hypothetical protein C484_19962 [Natrialba taiwanensis DSM 12281]
MVEPVDARITDSYMKERLTNTTEPSATVGQGPRAIASRLPTDLIGVAGFTVLAAVLLLIVEITMPVARVAIGFPLLFLAPGYVTVSVLFPRDEPPARTERVPLIGQTLTVTGTERAALSFGLSFALLPLLGLLIAATPLVYTVTSVVGTVCGFVLVGTALAAVRRARVAQSDRYQFSLARTIDALYTAVFGTSSPVHTAVNVVLVVSMLVALSSVGYALVAPQDGEQYTDMKLLTEDDSGELVTADYQTTTEPGESMPMTISVENQENAEREYTVVVQEQWVEDGSGDVFNRTEHERYSYELGDGDRELTNGTVTPDAESGTVRIAALLYEGEVPESPTMANADQSTYLWTTIEEASGDEDTDG